MKYIVAALMCGLLSLTLTGCQQSGTADVSISPAASNVQPVSSAPTASNTEPVNSAPDSIRIQLTRVEEQLTDADGQVLVEYAYDRPTVTISGNPTAQKAIQADLDWIIQTQLVDYAKEELLPQAQDAHQKGSASLPLSSQLNLSIQRTDEAVISILTDQIGETGARGSDYRSARNYRTETGEPLTFDMLGDRFRSTATALVTQQAERQAGQLFDDYQDNLSYVVLDGSEDGRVLYEVNTPVYPTFYLTNDDIVFISRADVLQSYSQGILEFPIPYSAFGSALDSSYLPTNYAPPSDSSLEHPSAVETDGAPKFQARNYLASSSQVAGNGWILTLPKEWMDTVYVELGKDSASFYENGCHSEMGGGWLFSLETYTDDSYLDLPDYELLSMDDKVSYVAIYPTDVQYEGASDKNAQRYSAFSSQVEGVVATFALTS